MTNDLANGSSLIDPATLKRPNVALWVTKEHEIYTTEEPFPECPADSCVIHVKATGICGSEIHFWKTGAIGDCCVTHPIILGHESAGQVVAVGANVRTFSVGDRISIEPGVACWECDQCLAGRYNLCPLVVFSGTPPSDGTMRRFVAHPARFLHKLPEGMGYDIGALIEPLSVGYHAVRRAAPYLGQPVVVAGAGPIGLATALNARAGGANPIVITDINSQSLDNAKAMGFDRTVLIDTKWDRHAAAAAMRAALGTELPSIVFECTGAPSSINAACYAIADGGTVLQVGCGAPEPSLPLMQLSFRECSIVSSFRYAQTWPVVLRLAASGVYGDLQVMITHRYRLEEAVKAMETAADRGVHSVKVQIIDE